LRVCDSQFGKLPAQLYRPASLRKTGVDDTSEFDDVLLQASVKPARQVQAVLVNTTHDRLLHTFRYATVLQGNRSAPDLYAGRCFEKGCNRLSINPRVFEQQRRNVRTLRPAPCRLQQQVLDHAFLRRTQPAQKVTRRPRQLLNET